MRLSQTNRLKPDMEEKGIVAVCRLLEETNVDQTNVSSTSLQENCTGDGSGGVSLIVLKDITL